MTSDPKLKPLSFPCLLHLHFDMSYVEYTRNPLFDFSSFPILQDLRIADWHIDDGTLPTSSLTHLPHLSALTINGANADDLSIASFCSLCPVLTHLTLECYLANYGALLKQLPPTLTHLKLLKDPDTPSPGHRCDHELPRFNLVQELSLDDGLYSPSLPLYLVGFNSLRILRLGKGHFSIEEMSKLLSGPTRLESLLRIEFNNALYSFDPKNPELVKTELPEEGWFALSLRKPDGLDG